MGMNMRKRSGPGNCWCKFDEHRSAEDGSNRTSPSVKVRNTKLVYINPTYAGLPKGKFPSPLA